MFSNYHKLMKFKNLILLIIIWFPFFVSCTKKDSSTQSDNQSSTESDNETSISWNNPHLGTSTYDDSKDIDFDAQNNVYLTGTTFGTLGNNNLGYSDIYIAKFNDKGSKQWVQQIGSSQRDYAWGLAIDSDNHIYVTGFTDGVLTGENNLGEEDIFLIKLDSDGNVKWTQQYGTNSNERVYRTAIDSNNNIYVTGYSKGIFDGNENSGGYDLFLIKFNSNGVKQWVKQLGSNYEDAGRGIAIDSWDNIYVIGYSYGSFEGNSNLGKSDVILIKFSSNGSKLWTKQLGTTENDYGYGVVIDSNDYIYFTGNTSGGFDEYSNLGKNDIILGKYNSNGVKQWIKQFGTSTYDRGNHISIDKENNILITGTTSGVLEENAYLGQTDIFLIKINPSGPRVWVKQLGTIEYDDAWAINLDTQNNIYLSPNSWGSINGNQNLGSWDVYLMKFDSNGNQYK